MNRFQMLILLLMTLSLLQGCTSLGSSNSEQLRIAGWVYSKQASIPQRLQFKFSILGEQKSGALHPLSTQKLYVYSLPTQYSVQTYMQPLWVRYWFEFQWHQQGQWHSIKQPLDSTQLTQTNIIQFINGEPKIEPVPTDNKDLSRPKQKQASVH